MTHFENVSLRYYFYAKALQISDRKNKYVLTYVVCICVEYVPKYLHKYLLL